MHYARATQRGPPQCPRFEPHCVLEFEINLLLKTYVIKKASVFNPELSV